MNTPWYRRMYHHQDWIPQGTTARYSLQLTDDAGLPLTLTQVTTVTLSIFNLTVQPPALIGGIWPRDVKNVPANGGSVSSTGLLTLTLSAVDNALSDEGHPYERRRWSIAWDHASGTKHQTHEVDRIIANIL